jgi:hypothetical protein
MGSHHTTPATGPALRSGVRVSAHVPADAEQQQNISGAGISTLLMAGRELSWSGQNIYRTSDI